MALVAVILFPSLFFTGTIGMFVQFLYLIKQIRYVRNVASFGACVRVVKENKEAYIYAARQGTMDNGIQHITPAHIMEPPINGHA